MRVYRPHQIKRYRLHVNIQGTLVPDSIRERIAELRARVSAGEKKAALAREFGISRETLYQYAPVSS